MDTTKRVKHGDKKKMRVLHVTGDIFRYNGAARQAVSLIKYLHSLDCRCEILSYTQEVFPKPKFEGIPVTICRYKPFVDMLKTAGKIITWKPDIIHLHGFFFEELVASVILRRPVLLKTTLFGVDDFDTISRSGRIRYKFARRYVYNNALAQYIAKINSKHIAKRRISVIPNGVAVPGVNTLCKIHPRQIVVVGVISERKGILETINYFNKLAKQHSELTLKIIGPTPDPDYFNKCKNAILPALANRVSFTGEVVHEEVLRHYTESTALLFASKNEGFPNAVIEAMAHNCVPISIGLDQGSREALADELQELILDSSSIISWDRVEQIMKSRIVYNMALKKYSIEAVAQRHYELYRSILSGV